MGYFIVFSLLIFIVKGKSIPGSWHIFDIFRNLKNILFKDVGLYEPILIYEINVSLTTKGGG